jgi:hypothetical protein
MGQSKRVFQIASLTGGAQPRQTLLAHLSACYGILSPWAIRVAFDLPPISSNPAA